MWIADRLNVPDSIQGFLFDMDGVLLDTLTFDVIHCQKLIQQHLDLAVDLSREFIRSLFAYHPPEFWQRIFAYIQIEYRADIPDGALERIVADYNRLKNEQTFSPNPGIVETLRFLKEQDIKTACVSNNPTQDVRLILQRAGLYDFFYTIVGNDIGSLNKKPAPDTYLYAAQELGIAPKYCAVLEDSLLGAEAGRRAGCFTIGVATGGADFRDLELSGLTHQVYTEFEPYTISLKFGNVTQKQIVTPNEFVSHALEHIAWRICAAINLKWHSNDWRSLGYALGLSINKLGVNMAQGAAMGMIDDGSAEVLIQQSQTPGLSLEPLFNLNLEWFLSLRCEQLPNGKPLTELLEGLAQGMSVQIRIRIPLPEDPHHAWEGIFRTIGLALSRMVTPQVPQADFSTASVDQDTRQGAIQIINRSAMTAQVIRKTAESRVYGELDLRQYTPVVCNFQVSPSIQVAGLQEMLALMAQAGNFSLKLDFTAEALSSSHVVLEDTGLLLGRLLKEIMVIRMNHYGVNGAGSNINSQLLFETSPLRVAVSVEGRKFWKFVPFAESYHTFRQNFLLGQTLDNGLFTEDLDDFIDGLSNGLSAGIVIHAARPLTPDIGWRLIFQHVGTALKETLAYNPYRKGVPPGVKATLA